jgi:hypothetical protein
MAKPPAAVRRLPPWLIRVGSALLVFHLFSLGVLVVAAQSGPWSTDFGSTPALGPQFAESINLVTTYYYLRPLGMTHTYHFDANRLSSPDVKFEVVLRDESGKEIGRRTFPDENTNFWVYHRQVLLSRWLGMDQPVPPRGPEVVGPGGKDVPKVSYLLGRDDLRRIPEGIIEHPSLAGIEELPPEKGNNLYLCWVGEDQQGVIPRDRMMPYFRPSDWELLVARSFVRHVSRQQDAASAELIRYYWRPVRPEYMFFQTQAEVNQLVTPEAFMLTVTYFGNVQRNEEEGSR